MIVVAEQKHERRSRLTSLLGDVPGLEVVGVSTARELIWNLENISLDLLIVSPALPDIGSRLMDLVRKIRANFSKLELPILLWAEQYDGELVVSGYEAGINESLVSPLDGDLVTAIVNHHLGMRREFKRLLVSYYRENSLGDPEATVTIDQQDSLGDSDRDRVIPCEIPMSLVAGKKSFFCKSIWLTHNSVLLLAFQEIPLEDKGYRLRLRNPDGGQIEMSVIEIRRELLRDTLIPGKVKLNLRITEAPQEFDALFSRLQRTYRESGEEAALEISKLPVDRTEDDNLEGTMIFSSDDAALSLTSGRRYRYEHTLGRGSFASVYLVEDKLLKRSVAMKVLSPEYSRVKEARRSFLNEAQIAAQFHHPNIVFVYEVGEIFQKHYRNHLSFPDHILEDHPQRFIYFTMQYVQGETLTNWVANQGRPSVEAFIGISQKILSAMDFAHRKGVTHRDIKPDNIMITGEDQVLVADFGIASLTQTEQDPGEKPKEIACTPKYAAPEQLLGKEMDGRSDLYSFGILAYEMLAGKTPFGGRTLTEIAKKHIKESPSPITKYRRDLDPELESVVLKCIEKQPEARFQSAAEVLEALARFQSVDEDRAESVMDALSDLIDQAIVVTNPREGARILEKLIAFINLHKTSDDVELIRTIRSRLSETSLINLLIEKNLNEDNFQLLYQFFMELGSTRPVSNLLHWFCRETKPKTKLFLGELAVISSGRDLKPLVTFGLELADHEASILLRSFGELNPRTADPIYLQWARHAGYQTQMELLKQITVNERPEEEVMGILDRYVNDGGTVHAAVRRLADKLLGERMLL